ncbi:hypothetical protein ACN267_31185 [Micromonospora sp. WMMD734]|uniref:hypothetical protein n=1 Tax=Micromonospora sp. WMMD734 TaxID=3404129 RepID=UPI003B9647B3
MQSQTLPDHRTITFDPMAEVDPIAVPVDETGDALTERLRQVFLSVGLIDAGHVFEATVDLKAGTVAVSADGDVFERGTITGPGVGQPTADPQPTDRLLAAVRAVIDAGHLEYDGTGVDVDRVQGEAHSRLVAAYAAVTGGTADTALTVRDRLAAELHRIADDLVRLDLPVGRNNGLGVGVLDSRADLDRWAAYLGSAVQVDNNGIPHVDHPVRLGDQYEELAVTAQTNRDPRGELERLRARVAELEAQQGGTR